MGQLGATEPPEPPKQRTTDVIESNRRAAVVSIGDELMQGSTVDTNGGEIAAALLDLGIETSRIVTVGDHRARLEGLFYSLCCEHPLVIATGGLGPTLDDLTREAAAGAAGVPLERNSIAEAELRGWFEGRGREMPETNLRQADFPQGAQVMPNPRGTAPGFRVWIEGGVLACLPGPPHEMRGMLHGDLLPWFQRTCGEGDAVRRAEVRMVGIGESDFALRAGDWLRRDAEPTLGICASRGVLVARLRARADTAERADAMLLGRLAEFRRRFEPWIFGEGSMELAQCVVDGARASSKTVAVAESCTGGLVAAALVSVPGASEVLREGFVTYSNEAKEARLGVPSELLREYGAVSSEVAAAMAEGARATAGSDLALSVTGIAGPEGGSEEKPVGLVHFGIAGPSGVRTHERRFPNAGRAPIRDAATQFGLDLLRRELLGLPAPSDPGAAKR